MYMYTESVLKQQYGPVDIPQVWTSACESTIYVYLLLHLQSEIPRIKDSPVLYIYMTYAVVI